MSGTSAKNSSYAAAGWTMQRFRISSRYVSSCRARPAAKWDFPSAWIFLPGMLILIGTLPFWETFRARAGAQSAVRGINAAVVGILGGAFYDPVWTSSVRTKADFSVALVGFVLLIIWRAPPVLVVVMGALAGIALAQIHA